MSSNGLNKIEKLIWTLLFSDANRYELDLEEYCKLENRTEFRDEIREILVKGKKKIIEDRIIHNDDKTIWKLEIQIDTNNGNTK